MGLAETLEVRQRRHLASLRTLGPQSLQTRHPQLVRKILGEESLDKQASGWKLKGNLGFIKVLRIKCSIYSHYNTLCTTQEIGSFSLQYKVRGQFNIHSHLTWFCPSVLHTYCRSPRKGRPSPSSLWWRWYQQPC